MTEFLNFINSNYLWLLGGAIITLLAIIGYYADKTNFGQGKRIETIDETKDEKPVYENKTLVDLIQNNSEVKGDFEENESLDNTIESNSDVKLDDIVGKEVEDTKENKEVPNTLESLDNKEYKLSSEQQGNLNLKESSEENMYESLEDKVYEPSPNVIKGSDNVEIPKYNEELSKNDDAIENAESLFEQEPEKEDTNISNKLEDNTESESKIDKEFDELDEAFSEVVPEEKIINDELLDDIDDMSLDEDLDYKISNIPDLDDVELPKISSFRKNNDEDIWKF